jgi:prepilin-type N-terminal cleavage/methylation domain-containing protein
MILKNKLQKGFTLVEMAIVLVIFGLLLSALFLPLQAQQQQAARGQTLTTLENAKTAILGYAQSHGRLPCPATAASNGMEAPLTGGVCTTQLGFLPAASLGVQPTDANGFAIDAWNNRIMYAVAQHNAGGAVAADYTTSNDMNTVGLGNLTPELRVCSSSAVVTTSACSGAPETNYLINNAVVVIYSLGPTGGSASGGVDENLNPKIPTKPKSVFVSHGIVSSSVNEFDHLVSWISPYTLYNTMIQAGQLH